MSLRRIDPDAVRGARLLLLVLYVSPQRAAGVLALLLLSGVAEGLGVASLLPLLSVVSDASTAVVMPDQPVLAAAMQWLENFGLTPLVALMVMLFWLKAAAVITARVQMGNLSARLSTDLRAAMIEALAAARWEYFKRRPAGELSNMVTTEVSQTAGAINGAFDVIAAGFQVAVYMLLALAVSWQITLIGIAAGALVWVALYYFVRLSRHAGNVQQYGFEKVVSRFVDYLVCIKALKAMSVEERFGDMIRHDNELIYDGLRLSVVSKAFMTGLSEPLLVTIVGFAAIVAMVFLDVPLPTMMVVGIILHRTSGAVMRVQQRYQVLAGVEGFVQNALRALSDTDDAAEPHRGASAPRFQRALTVEHVSFAFGTQAVLQDSNLIVEAGTITALLGPSGSGKTTLIDLIIGLYDPDSGAIRVDGVPLADIDVLSWRRQLGYVPQEILLFNDTLLANVTLRDPALTEEDAHLALQSAGASSFVDSLPEGLQTPVGERGLRFSGGQRQRIALARAMIRKPALLILDEPTTALDPQTEAEICATLKSLAHQTTVLVISHQAALVDIADHVFRMSAGHVYPSHERLAPAAAAG